MNPDRLRQLRRAAGLSLEALASEMGDIVSKQAISKYEHGRAQPSDAVIRALATALEVSPAQLDDVSELDVRFIAYRKKSRLIKREQLRIENMVSHELQKRVTLSDLTGGRTVDVPVQALAIRRVEAAEEKAQQLRETWDIGAEQPIASLTDVLENRLVHVLEVAAEPKFDGLSAVAYRDQDTIAATAVISRSGLPGERQRLNLAHELGHQVLKIPKSVDEEESAFRFAAAFLVPARSLIHDVGQRRTRIRADELLILKEKYGVSLQSLLVRLRTLRIINDSHYREWFRELGRLGWRKREPNPISPETPQWLTRTVLRAVAERCLSAAEAQALYGVPLQ